ncbi:hypothetical protein BDW22DRAFT_715224 [Trametopsis cervina]|nr:hypothetical protein BDW22DRAFT_715224 [Trametopsis cervina]
MLECGIQAVTLPARPPCRRSAHPLTEDVNSELLISTSGESRPDGREPSSLPERSAAPTRTTDGSWEHR